MAPTRPWALTLPEALRQVIVREASNDQAMEILAATGRSSDRLVGYLGTLIGAAGARALQQRSLTLSGRQHAWLVTALASAGTAGPIERMAGGVPPEPGLVLDASVGLLASFVNLLVAFIGERLTVQVLCQVWPDVAPLLRPEKESP